MTSQPIDEDGFHSIAWDDAPPSSRFQPSSASSANTALPSGGMGGFGETESEGGFETISPPSDAGFNINANSNAGDSGFAGSSKGTMTSPGRSEVAQGQGHQRHISSGTVSGERLHAEVDPSEWGGKWMAIDVKDPVKEHEGSKDMFVSYAVRTRTNLANYPHQSPVVRRRFQDFAFLRDHLVKAFPASVVPPIPDKHRMEYIKGDRFSPEFVERRRLDLQRFADRIGRHPILQRAKLVEDFLTSTEWSVAKHHHISHPPPDSHSSLVDSLSDTFINAFSRVRKPDQRFVEITQGQERFEEGLGGVEKIVGRGKSRMDDLASDYQDMAAAYQTLGYLESGITEPLNRFAEKMLDFAALLRHTNGSTTEPFLHSTHALLAHSSSHRGVIKLRDQKQLDFEELSAYLSAVVSERDRLAALQSGHSAAPVGLGTYLRDQVDRIRGTDDIHTRRERMRKMDGKITELQEAVTTAHETSTAFNEQVLREHAYFEMNKQHEMKDMLQQYADGQVEMLKRAMDDWDRIIPVLERIRVDI